MAKGDELQGRFIDFSVTICALCARIPKTVVGAHVAKQLVRSGTAPASNYAEARAAESAKDFIHKLKIVLKELNESMTWLETLQRGKTCIGDDIDHIIAECTSLCRIIAASIKTASGTRPSLDQAAGERKT